MVEEEETDVFDIALMQLYGEKEDKNCFINARFKKKSWGEKYVKTFSIFLFSKFPSTLIRTIVADPQQVLNRQEQTSWAPSPPPLATPPACSSFVTHMTVYLVKNSLGPPFFSESFF